MNTLEFLILQIPIIELTESILYIVGTIFTQLKKLQYAIVAFLLFGIFLFYEFLEHSIPFDNPFGDIIIPLMGVSILVLFFLAIVNKK